MQCYKLCTQVYICSSFVLSLNTVHTYSHSEPIRERFGWHKAFATLPHMYKDHKEDYVTSGLGNIIEHLSNTC